jgi:methylmalonyl-CoA/ethylmalonyl-CoA epimerase
MRSGIKLYHLAYETEGLATSIATMRAQGAKLVVEPVPAVAFAGRDIAFLMLRNRMLVELIART